MKNKYIKYKDMQNFSIEELKSKIFEEKEILRKHSFAHSISSIDNPMLIKQTRKVIARLNTKLSALYLNRKQTKIKND